MNKSFQPTATDIASYVQVIDKNKSGKVSVDELENFIIRYFLNANRT
jgi:Ca2+-binding EF-hand superfamily protein